MSGPADPPGAEPEIEIQINRQVFRIARRALSGAELRRLPTPPLGDDLDIYQVSPQAGAPDVPVPDDQLIDWDNGKTFFSAPRHVLPGAAGSGRRATGPGRTEGA